MQIMQNKTFITGAQWMSSFRTFTGSCALSWQWNHEQEAISSGLVHCYLLFFYKCIYFFSGSMRAKCNANHTCEVEQKGWTYMRWKTTCLQQRFCQTCRRRSSGWKPWCRWWCQWNRPKGRGSWGRGWRLGGLWTGSKVSQSCGQRWNDPRRSPSQATSTNQSDERH